MSTKTYDTLEGSLTVRPTPTVSRSGGSNAVAIIGGYDSTDSASDVSAGDATKINDPVNAEDQFGGSEITRAAALATANGSNELYGVPVSNTESTESFASTSSFTLSEDYIVDPSLNPDESITVTDTVESTDLTVNIVYEDTVSTPSNADTANVNPISGDIETDASSDYDVTFSTRDYSNALSAAADLPVRYLCVLTEDPSVKASVTTELSDIAADFDFKRAVVGADPNIQPTDIGTYSPAETDWRMVEVAPSRCEGADGAVRTAAAVAGFMAAQPIGPDGSTLYDDLSGIVSLGTEYRGTEAKSFEGVTSITRNGTVAQAITTSTAEQFQNVYATEIIDEVALRLFSVAQSYAGGPQDLGELRTLLRGVCLDASNGTPPLLGFAQETEERPFDITVSVGSDSGVADGSVTIVPTPIAEEVNLNLTVADGFVSFSGAQ